MTEISINPAKQTLSVEIKPQSLHVFAISITVFDSNKVKILEQHSGKIDINKTLTQILSLKPSMAADKYINLLMTIESLTGEDNFYSATISFLEDNVDINQKVEIKGITLCGESSNLTRIHIN